MAPQAGHRCTPLRPRTYNLVVIMTLYEYDYEDQDGVSSPSL